MTVNLNFDLSFSRSYRHTMARIPTKAGRCSLLHLVMLIFYVSFIKADFIKHSITSSCDHVTRRVLAAELKTQTKTIVRSRLSGSGRDGPHLNTATPEGTECDVWTVKASGDVKGQDNQTLTLTLLSLDIQEHSQVLLLSEHPDKQLVFKSEQGTEGGPALALPVTLASPSGLSLVWAHTVQQPGSENPGPEEHVTFSYSLHLTDAGFVAYNVTNPLTTSANPDNQTIPQEKKKKDKVLISAIVVCVVTATATVASIVRTGVCSRWRFFCQYRRVRKSDRTFTERVTRQESFQLDSLRPAPGVNCQPVGHNSNHCNDRATYSIASDGYSYRSNNCANSVTGDVTTSDGSFNRSGTRINHDSALCGLPGHQTASRGRELMDGTVFLELEVRGRPVDLEQRLALTGNGSGEMYDIHAESDAAGYHVVRLNSLDDDNRRRRVRFQDNDDVGDNNSDNQEVGEPTIAYENGNSVRLNSTHSQDIQSQPTISSQSSTAPNFSENPVVQTSTFALPRPLTTACSDSQTQLNSSSALSPMHSSHSSFIDPSVLVPPPPQHRPSHVSSTSETASCYTGNPGRSILVTSGLSRAMCPNCCSPTGAASDTRRGRLSSGQLIQYGHASVVASLDMTTSPPYIYGQTPPPAYSTLFPE
ncbi:hypothetical protein ElyMa_000382400 [Elysia marginata]|uniref:CUB domain-containing protein n=1 Tax=Elysia marginata TaxID=1093978 RepID=A0AAV4FHL3_9GAST|nr:hypothetical protein ElyMa_000382400 [Elysia marginata]